MDVSSLRMIYPRPWLTGPALGMFEMFGRTGPPTLGSRQKCCNHLQMRFASIQCSKMQLRPGLRPGPRWGSLYIYSAPPDPLAGFKEGKGNGGKEKGKGGEEQGGGRGGEGRLILMRRWNRAADWLRPALLARQQVLSV